MKRLVLNPAGWPCRLAECPSGLLVHEGELRLKTAYAEHYLGSGDAWGYAKPDLIVQPVVAKWEEEEL